MKSVPSDPIDNLSVVQTMLVRACLAENREARAGYVRAWEEQVQIADLDFSSSRLIPYLLHKNQQDNIKCLHDKRLKVIYKYWWLRTQHIAHQLSLVHAAFRANGIDVAVIKGASITQYYERAELRPMSDFDLLVPVQQLPQAIDTLRKLDFIPDSPEPACFKKKQGLLLDFGHAVFCANRNNDTFIDLHWKIGSNCTKRFTGALWNNLVPYPALQAARKPALAYEVFMILIHAADMANRDNLNWIVDMASLQKAMNGSVWQEARQLAVDEKKEDLFDYACSILLQFGISAPDPGAVKVPKRLFYKTLSGSGFIQWVCNGPRTVKNLMYIVDRLYPYAPVWEKCHQLIRNVRFVFVSRRIGKRIKSSPYC